MIQSDIEESGLVCLHLLHRHLIWITRGQKVCIWATTYKWSHVLDQPTGSPVIPLFSWTTFSWMTLQVYGPSPPLPVNDTWQYLQSVVKGLRLSSPLFHDSGRHSCLTSNIQTRNSIMCITINSSEWHLACFVPHLSLWIEVSMQIINFVLSLNVASLLSYNMKSKTWSNLFDCSKMKAGEWFSLQKQTQHSSVGFHIHTFTL